MQSILNNMKHSK